MNAFKKALLDVVLEEYTGLGPGAYEPPEKAGPELNFVWIDREHRHLYSTRHDGCSQHLFPDREKMDAYVRLLKMQGYSQE